MEKEFKIKPISRSYMGENIPKSIYDDLLTKYERSLVHLGQLNRYMIEFKNITEKQQLYLKKKDRMLADKSQDIAELEMYINALEEYKSEKAQKETFLSKESKQLQGEEVSCFQPLSSAEREALDQIFNA